MTRAVIVSTSGGLLEDYWLKNAETWKHKVDKIYVVNSIGGNIYPKNVEDKIREITEDLLLIMHDDTFIYDPEILDEYFELAKTKAVTPIHASHVTDDLTENALREKYGNNWSFFPYFLFVSRENILKTSVNLQEYKTEKCPILGVATGGDIGFLLSLELRNTGTEIHPITRYLAHELPENPPWVHAQGLSIGFLENIFNKPDEYRVAWLAKIADLDINKIKDTYDRL